MKKENLKKWFTLFILILGGGTIYKLSSMKDAFYGPMQEAFKVNNGQIGALMSAWGTVGTFGNFIAIYISDRFSKKKLLPLGLIGTGCVGLFMCTFPSYQVLLVCFGLLAVFDTIIYWPVLLKAVRLLGNKDEQGRMFGLLESGRGVVDIVVAFSALGIFAVLGQGITGFRSALLVYSIAPIVIGIISFFLLEDDKVNLTTKNGVTESRNKIALQGVWKAIKSPEIWAVSLNVFVVYCIYIGVSMFIPFLKDVYALPITLVGAYGIINQYGLKIIGGPVGGYLSDKKCKSATKYLRITYAVAAIAMAVVVLLPHESMNVYFGMAITLSFGAIVFSMRSVFFAPVEEVNVPREISGAAMSIISFIGYAPSMFMYAVYGSIIDKFPGLQGYRMIFMIMIALSVVGIVVSTAILKVIKKKNMAQAGGNAA